MATEYTHKKVDSEFYIYRNEDHVANYEPVSGEITYFGDSKKFAGPIAKEITKIVTDVPTKVEKEVSRLKKYTEEPTAIPDKEVVKLRKYIASLEAEVCELRAKERGEAVVHTPERYEGVPVGAEGSPVMGNEGDLTPDYLKWAREGGYTEEQFIQAYKGRVKDLTYKG